MRSASRFLYFHPSQRRSCQLTLNPLSLLPYTKLGATLCRVYTPYARALCRNEEEDEAIEHSEFSLVYKRQQRVGAVRHPVRRRHLATTNKRRPASEKTDHDEDPPDQLDRTTNIDNKWRDSFRQSSRKSEELLRAMPEEQEAGDDAHERIGLRVVRLHKCGHICPPFL